MRRLEFVSLSKSKLPTKPVELRGDEEKRLSEVTEQSGNEGGIKFLQHFFHTNRHITYALRTAAMITLITVGAFNPISVEWTFIRTR